MSPLTLIGKTARVTATLSAQTCGEVLVDIRQGSEAYMAYAAEHCEIPKGTKVLIVDEAPGRVVYVTPS